MTTSNNHANENEVKDQFVIEPRCYHTKIDINDIPKEDSSQSLTYNSFYEQQLLSIIKSQLSYKITPVGTTIALTGKLGSGKSTIIKHVQEELLDYINNEVNKEYCLALTHAINLSACISDKNSLPLLSAFIDSQNFSSENNKLALLENPINTQDIKHVKCNNENLAQPSILKYGSTSSPFVEYTQELNRKYVDLKISEFKCLWFQGDDALMNAFLEHMYSQLNILGKDIVNQFLDVISSIADAVANIRSEFKAAKPIIDIAKRHYGNKEPKSIEEKLNKLAEALKQDSPEALKQGRVTKFLIIIDDLDRLYPNEVLAIFRIIKSVGFLPNIMFLLAFDKGIVDKTIAKYYPEDHKIFLDKFIQIYVDIPPKDISLFEKFKTTLKEKIPSESYTQYILSLFTQSVPELKHIVLLKEAFDLCVHTFRDVNRLSSSVSEKWLLFKEYIDIYDLILLELLKMFCDKGWDLLYSCAKTLPGDELTDSKSLLKILNNTPDYQDLQKDSASFLIFNRFLSYLNESKNTFPLTMFSCPCVEYCYEGSIVSAPVFKSYFNTIPQDTIVIGNLLKILNNLGSKIDYATNLKQEVNNTVNELYEFLHSFTSGIQVNYGRPLEFDKILEANVESPIYLGVFMIIVRLLKEESQETTNAILYCFDGLFWRVAENSYRNIYLYCLHIDDGNNVEQLFKIKRLDEYILTSICTLLEKKGNTDIISDLVKANNMECTLGVAFHFLILKSLYISDKDAYEEFNQLFYAGLNSLIDDNKFFKHYRCLCILIKLSYLYKDDKQDLLLALGKKISKQLENESIDNNLFKQAIYAFMCGRDIYCNVHHETLSETNSTISSLRYTYVSQLLDALASYNIPPRSFVSGLMNFIKNIEIDPTTSQSEQEASLKEKEGAELLINYIKKQFPMVI